MTQLFLAIILCVPAPPADSVSGTIVDTDGIPIAGAVVGVSEFRYDGKGEQLFTTTDDHGKYTFKELSPHNAIFWTLIAYKPGFGLTSKRIPRNTDSVDVTLEQPDPLTIRFYEPDGSVTQEVEFELSSVSGFPINVNEEFAGTIRLPDTTVVNGVLKLGFLTNGAQLVFKTKHPRLGTQSANLIMRQSEYKINFRPTTRIQGIVDLSDTEPQEYELVFRTTQTADNPGNDEINLAGQAVVKPDSKGRFQVDAILSGKLAVSISNKSKLPFFLKAIKETKLTPGIPTDMNLKLERSVLVKGTVVGEDGSPIAGAILSLNGTPETDAAGKFEFYCRPGIVHGGFWSVPAPWLSPGFDTFAFLVPQNRIEFIVPTTRLRKASPITGIVVDRNGNPQPGATVSAKWLAVVGAGAFTDAHDSAISDEKGNFELTQVDPSVRTSIKAQSQTHASTKSLVVLPGFKREIRVVVEPGGRALLNGRIVDKNGEPIIGAKVSMMRIGTNDRGRQTSMTRIFIDKNQSLYQLTSDDEGRFGLSRPLSIQYGIALEISAEGYAGVKLEPRFASRENGFDFDDIVLERSPEIAGTILDSNGNPVSGVKVWTHGFGGWDGKPIASTKTDDDGQFKLTGANLDARFAFVEHPDYRFTGFAIPESDGTPLTLRVALTSQPPLDAPLQFSNRPSSVRNELLMRLLEPMIHSDRQTPMGQRILQNALVQIAQTHPEFTASEIPTLTSPAARADLLFQLAEVDAALEQSAGLAPSRRLLLIAKFIRMHPAAPQFEKLFVEAIACIGQINETSGRLRMAATLILACRVSGLNDHANQLCDKYLSLAQSGGYDDYTSGLISKAFALTHPDVALKSIQSIKDEVSFGQHMSDTLWQVAVAPDVADRFLAACPNPDAQAGSIARMAFRMSTVDLNHALSLARNSGDRYQGLNSAIALGQIAFGIYETKPDQARQVIQEAFGRLPQITQRHYHYWFGPSLRLLNQAMVADHENTGEYFWRALAHTNAPDAENPNHDRQTNRENNFAQVAILLNRYGRYPEIEKQIVDSIFDHWEQDVQAGRDYRDHVLAYTAMTMHDPARAIAWYHDVWQLENYTDRARPDAPWYLMARLIRSQQPETGRVINRKVFHSWNTGDPYLYSSD